MNKHLPKTRDCHQSMSWSKSQLHPMANLERPFTKVETPHNYTIVRAVQIIKIWLLVLTCNNSLLNLRWGLWKLRWLTTIIKVPETSSLAQIRVTKRLLCRNRVKIIHWLETLWLLITLQTNVIRVKLKHRLVKWRTSTIYLKFPILTIR